MQLLTFNPSHASIAAVIRFDVDSTAVQRQFDCLSKVIEVTLAYPNSRSFADLLIYLLIDLLIGSFIYLFIHSFIHLYITLFHQLNGSIKIRKKVH